MCVNKYSTGLSIGNGNAGKESLKKVEPIKGEGCMNADILGVFMCCKRPPI